MTEPELSFSDSSIHGSLKISEREALARLGEMEAWPLNSLSVRRQARSWGEVVPERRGAGMQRGSEEEKWE